MEQPVNKTIFIHHKDYGKGRLVTFSPFIGVAVLFPGNGRRFFSTAEHNLIKLSCDGGIPMATIVDREMRDPRWHQRRNDDGSYVDYFSMPIWPA